MKLKCLTVVPLLAAAALSSGSTFGVTFTVTNTNDSGSGSLRQAITNANGTPGADTIAFNIPGTGQRTIRLLSLLSVITETVSIDGGNGGDASNRVELIGAGALSTGLDLEGAGANNSVIRNLGINGFATRQILLLNVADCVIEGNFIGLNAAGTAVVDSSGDGIEIGVGCSGILIGGADAAVRNVISSVTSSGVTISLSSAVVQGNFIGLNAAGTARVGWTGAGISVNNGSVTVGGTNPGEGNVIVADTGIAFGGNPVLGRSTGTVQGNLVGTDAAGTTALNLVGVGISVDHATGVLINGGNVISGNSTGILIHSRGDSAAPSDLTTVQGNFIGAAADGVTAVGNSHIGVDLASPNNTIGGTGSGEGNVIAFNGETGVRIGFDTGNSVLGNSIFANRALGIDLIGGDDPFTGVTLNDPGDADAGPNNLQNFPVITGLTINIGKVTIDGTFNSEASKTYRLEFFASASVDPTGYGEGQTFLGFANVTTDVTGNVTFTVTLPIAGNPTTFTATATDPAGNTSEFSAAFTIKLLNISSRLQVLTDDNVLIGGFILPGISSKRVIVRAIGPSLTAFGVPGALMDPTLELYAGDGTLMATNDNWKDDQQTEIEATGLAPTSDAESAIVQTLIPGTYTFIVRGVLGTTGVGLIEAYDLDPLGDSRLANISSRGFIDTGANVMIGGFIIGPRDLGEANLLVRALGPSLVSFGIADALQDPVLELHSENGDEIAINDNWGETQQTEIQATGLAPTDGRESAILSMLPPGAYTAIVRGALDTTGVGLLEVYDLDSDAQ